MNSLKRFFHFLTLLSLAALITVSATPALAVFDLQQEIIDKPAGGTVTVPEGTYAVNLIIDKSITLVASGDVVLTRPSFEPPLIPPPPGDPLNSEEVTYPEDMPVITVAPGAGSVTIDGFIFDDPEVEVALENSSNVTTIGILAGTGVDLTLSNCSVNAQFHVPVIMTTWDQVFNEGLGDVSFFDIDLYGRDDATETSSLTISGCDFRNYGLAGVAILGESITAEISNNTFIGHYEDPEASASDANQALSILSDLGSASVSGNLFSEDLLNQAYPDGICGVIVVNGNDDQVRMLNNTISRNIIGVGAIKEISQLAGSFLEAQAAVEAGQGLSLEVSNDISGNMVGVAAVGGLEVLLEWDIDEYIPNDDDDYDDLIISPDIALNTDPMPLFIQNANFTNNLVGTVIAGKVKATVDSNVYNNDIAVGLAGLGDLSETYITDNEFNGIIGASMVFALQKLDITSVIEEGLPLIVNDEDSERMIIDQQGTLTISGNTIAGNGPIEGAHELIDGLLNPDAITQQTLALGQRTANNGPLAILPSPDDPEQPTIGLDDVSLAGIVLLDGARNISMNDNTVGGTLLGVTAIDTGIVEDIQNINITDNTVEGNICGMTLVGAGKVVVPLIEGLRPKDFMSADNKLQLGEVSGNSFNSNHIGMISALSVDGEIHGNYFDDNALLGMAHIGVGDWLFGYLIPPVTSGDICPDLDIYGNSITGNGTDQENGPAILDYYIMDGISAADFLCGGVLVIDASQGITLNENNIAGNGNFGVLATARAEYDPSDLESMTTKVVSIDEAYILDASNNWWGNENGPGSYQLSEELASGAEETLFLDPDNGDPADGDGDSLGSFLVGIGEEDLIYFPFTLTGPLGTSDIEVLFLEEENTVKFSDWAAAPFEINSSNARSSGSGFCGIASFTPSVLLLLAPLVLIIGKK